MHYQLFYTTIKVCSFYSLSHCEICSQNQLKICLNYCGICNTDTVGRIYQQNICSVCVNVKCSTKIASEMTLEVIMLKVIWEKNQSKNFLSKNLATLCKGCTSDHSDFKYLKNIFPKKSVMFS